MTSTPGSSGSAPRRWPRCTPEGPLPASQLTKLVPDLARQLRMAVGKKYEGLVGVSTRMLFLLLDRGAHRPGAAARLVAVQPVPVGADGRLDRRTCPACPPTRPAPSWRGGGCGRTDRARSTTSPGGRSGRRPTCAPRWRHGRRGGGHDGHRCGCRRRRPGCSADDLDDTPAEAAAPGRSASRWPCCPASTRRSWGGRSAAGTSDPHRGPLFDRNGNAGPTVWVGGRAVGAWSQRAGRRGRHPAARARGHADGRARRRRRRALDGVDGRRPGHPPVPDAARPRARRPPLIRVFAADRGSCRPPGDPRVVRP